ncbi:MAG TPA: hypothetical protein VHC18_21690 [Amycolatopsis sp.]|nr:hypothetical protein [Amycolatopsis sp.]
MPLRRALTAGTLSLSLVFLSSTPAVAETSIPIGSCSATVDGRPGQQLLLDPAAVAEPITQALTKLDPLGVLTSAFPADWAASGPIPLGTVADSQTQIAGTAIADAVTERLGRIPLLGPVLQTLTSSVHQTLSSRCGILVRPVLPGARPPAAAPGPSGQAPAPANPGGTGSPAAGGPAAPAPDTGPAGGGVVFGSPLPDGALLPLHGGGVPGAGVPIEAQQPVSVVSAPQTAGSAAALPTTRDKVSTSTLTALLLLSLVSALLVRRWVLGGRA